MFEVTDLLTLYADHAVFTVRLVFDSSLKNSGGVKRIREVVPAWGRNLRLSLLPVLWTSCSDRQSELWKLIHEELVFPRLHSHWLNNPSGTGVQVYLSRYFVLNVLCIYKQVKVTSFSKLQCRHLLWHTINLCWQHCQLSQAESLHSLTLTLLSKVSPWNLTWSKQVSSSFALIPVMSIPGPSLSFI